MTVLTLQWSRKAVPIALAWSSPIHSQPLTVAQAAEPERTASIIAVAPAGTGLARYHHVQVSAQPTWIIPHNLGKIPVVALMDASGNVIEADVSHLDLNVTQVEFTHAAAGDAYLYA